MVAYPRRPLIVKLCGPGGHWSPEWLEGEASAFFAGRQAVAVGPDLKVWVSVVLHKVFLDHAPTEAESAELISLQWQWMKNMAIPDAVGSPALPPYPCPMLVAYSRPYPSLSSSLACP